MAVLVLFARLIMILLELVSYAMIVRMLFPLFARVEDSKIYNFVCCVTEPFIAPVRFLLVKLNLLQNSPIDWSFTITYLIIILLQSFLPSV